MSFSLADFLHKHRDAILEAWEAEVRQLPVAQSLSRTALPFAMEPGEERQERSSN